MTAVRWSLWVRALQTRVAHILQRTCGDGRGGSRCCAVAPLMSLGFDNLERVIRDIIAALAAQKKLIAAAGGADSARRLAALEAKLAERDSVIRDLRADANDTRYCSLLCTSHCSALRCTATLAHQPLRLSRCTASFLYRSVLTAGCVRVCVVCV